MTASAPVCRRVVTWFAGLLALLIAPAASAQQAPAKPAITVRLLAERPTVAPGTTVTLALVMRPAAGWHGYWKNPGDSGMETQVAWRLPAGVGAGALRYPAPTTLLVSGVMNHVYEREYALLVDLTVPAGLAAGLRLPIRARVDQLACTKEICVPQTAQVALDLTVRSGVSATDDTARFDGYRRMLPRPLGATARFERAGDTVRIAVPVASGRAASTPHLFALTDGALSYAAPQRLRRIGDELVIETRAGANRSLDAFNAVLRVDRATALAMRVRRGAVAAAPDPERDGIGTAAAGTALAALAGAILGGVLLNVMPCVFPILSLKAIALARAGGDERAARREAAAYALGAVLVCGALGGVLLALRASGAAAGWAFQLQDPRVVLGLLLLCGAIALNLAGLFELPTLPGGDRLTRRGGVAGAFWTGALAAFVATPCTGPFMGAALGAALILPPAIGLLVFAGLGLGLALPFLLLGFVPALRRRLPRPGAWMRTFRHILAVPMFLTTLALGWVLGRQAGVDALSLGLAALLALGLALWIVGQRASRSVAWPALAAAGMAVIVAVALLPGLARPAAIAGPPPALAAMPYDAARLAALRTTGRPVFVYFTADWCVTCKVNERVAIDRADVAKAFAARRVAVLVGDWTRGDPAIGQVLQRHGRSGVPLYLYYAPGRPAKILPQVLTPARLVSMVQQGGDDA